MIIWQDLNKQERAQVLARPFSNKDRVLSTTVSEIIERVENDGDTALKAFSQKFDGVELPQLRLSEERKRTILATLNPDRQAAIELAYNNIRAFHLAQKPQDIEVDTAPGVNCRLLNRAIGSVGLYIPGGSAPLPSTVLMLGIPAQLAECRRVVLCTPAFMDENQEMGVTTELVYAAKLCGIEDIFLTGGAQAVAAMAYGTESIPKVDKIFGPGNRFVTEAKLQVSLDASGAAIDMPAGPSEVLIIADSSANPFFLAADLLSQAEHGIDSQVILLCNDQRILAEVESELETQVQALSRCDIATESLKQSRLILTRSVQESVEISNDYAPEHLIVQTDNPESLLPALSSAASIFLGPYTPESAGDYASGTNHVLPTYGYARTLSSLSLTDFYRRFTVQRISAQGLKTIGPSIMTLAEAEGLDGHRNAVRIRLEALEQEAESCRV